MTSKLAKFLPLLIGDQIINKVGGATNHEVDAAPLKESMYNYAARGDELIQETISFSNLMLHLADLAGDLKVAEKNLQIAVEQVERAKKMLEDLKIKHDEYVKGRVKKNVDFSTQPNTFDTHCYHSPQPATTDATQHQNPPTLWHRWVATMGCISSWLQ